MVHWLAIAMGGALGAMSRYALTAYVFPIGPGRFPTGTLAANVIGCSLIGFCYVVLMEKEWLAEQWRPFIITGFLGALTTFSTFSLEAVELWRFGHGATALVYVGASLIACLAATAATIMAAHHFLQ